MIARSDVGFGRRGDMFQKKNFFDKIQDKSRVLVKVEEGVK
jgi:hypothetical protein